MHRTGLQSNDMFGAYSNPEIRFQSQNPDSKMQSSRKVIDNIVYYYGILLEFLQRLHFPPKLFGHMGICCANGLVKH